jgi:hypothetical protein
MGNERRYHARLPIDHPVYIRYHKRPFLRARARDVSVGGMFLRVQALTLPAGTPIELELEVLGKRWLVPAIVVRADHSGIGVMFCEPQTALFKDLMQSGADLPPAAAKGPGGKPLPNHH